MSEHEIRETVLALLESGSALLSDSTKLAKEHNWNHERLVGVLKSLQSREVLVATQSSCMLLEITPEGLEVLEQGSPEFKVHASIPIPGGIAKNDLQV